MGPLKSIKHKTDANLVPISLKKPKIESKPLHLFDLNRDCLRSVIDLLERRDLVNVAMINGKVDVENQGRFAEIAAEIFAKNELKDENYMLVSSFSDGYSINLLQCFGHLIKKLEIYYSSDWLENKLLNDAFIKYCNESLSYIKFVHIQNDPLFGSEKCFPNVLQVEIVDGVCFQAFQFNNIFPNAHTLILSEEFNECEYGQGDWIAECFPAMKSFCLTLFGCGLTYDQFKACLRLNPQLEHLKIRTYRRSDVVIDAFLLAFINEKLPNLKSLDVTLEQNDPSVPADILCFEKLEELTIIAGAVFPNIQLDKIEKISLHVDEINEACIEFLSKCGNASIISVIGDLQDCETFKDFIELIVNMPELKELYIEHLDTVDQNEIRLILNACKELTQLSAHMRYIGDYDDGGVDTMICSLFREFENDWIWCIRNWKLYHIELEFKANTS